jgi:hypothetical protein
MRANPMTDKKNWGQSVMGWFIVSDDEQPHEGAPSADTAPPSTGSATSAVEQVFVTTPPPAIDGKVNFDAVFASAGIDDEGRTRVTKAVELMASLPSDTPVVIKKQIVEASLKAFGVPIDEIIEAGVGEIQALEGYIRAGSADTQQVLADAEKRIALYEDEIRQLRGIMEQRVAEQQVVVKACNDKKLTVQQVLEFFGQEAVARVVAASPKLHAPSAG